MESYEQNVTRTDTADVVHCLNETNRLLAAIGNVLESLDQQLLAQNVERIRQMEINREVRRLDVP